MLLCLTAGFDLSLRHCVTDGAVISFARQMRKGSAVTSSRQFALPPDMFSALSSKLPEAEQQSERPILFALYDKLFSRLISSHRSHRDSAAATHPLGPFDLYIKPKNRKTAFLVKIM
jgi:hypothetical protein